MHLFQNEPVTFEQVLIVAGFFVVWLTIAIWAIRHVLSFLRSTRRSAREPLDARGLLSAVLQERETRRRSPQSRIESLGWRISGRVLGADRVGGGGLSSKKRS